MIPASKIPIALKVVQRVITVARSNAYTGIDAHTIAPMLDQADYLLALVLDEDKELDEFRRILRELGNAYPQWFSRLLENFDAEPYRNEGR